jgi:hypothetical protein
MSYQSEQESMLKTADSIRKNHHDGLNGSALENLLVKFLEKFIEDPDLGISKGLIRDSQGDSSKEVDIIIYHKPSLFLLDKYDNSYSIFPVENVVAVISVKASVSGYGELTTKQTSHYENLMSVKRLLKVITRELVYTSITAAFTYNLESSITDIANKMNNFILNADPNFWYSNDGQYRVQRFDDMPEMVNIDLPIFYYPDLFCFLNKGLIITNPGHFHNINPEDRRKISSVTILDDSTQTLKNFFFWLKFMIDSRKSRSYRPNIRLYEKFL